MEKTGKGKFGCFSPVDKCFGSRGEALEKDKLHSLLAERKVVCCRRIYCMSEQQYILLVLISAIEEPSYSHGCALSWGLSVLAFVSFLDPSVSRYIYNFRKEQSVKTNTPRHRHGRSLRITNKNINGGCKRKTHKN